MKRIVTLILALIMCMGVFSAFGLSASAETSLSYLDDRIVYHNDFSDSNFTYDNGINVPTNTHFLGFTALAGYENSCIDRNEGALKLTSTAANAIVDFRLYNVTNLATVTNDSFVISMDIKVDPNGSNMGGNFWGFRNNPAGSWQWMFKVLSDGTLQVLNKNTPCNVKNGYVTLECGFKKTTDGFSVNAYANGTLYGTTTVTMAKIDHFRCFWTTKADQVVYLSSVTLAKAPHSLYSEICNADFEQSNTSLSGWNLFDGLKIQYLAAANYKINNGKFEITGASSAVNPAFDLRFKDDNAQVCPIGDVTMSLGISVSGTWSGADNAMMFRDSVTNNKLAEGEQKVFRIKTDSDGVTKFGMKPSVKGDIELNNGWANHPIDLSTQYVDITWAFDYDYTNSKYTSVTCYVNGDNLGTLNLTKDIKDLYYIRFFNGATCGDVSIDYIKFNRGTDHGYVAPTEKTGFIGYQATEVATGLTNLRLIGIIRDADVTNYTKVGFKVTANTASGDINIANEEKDVYEVYEKITATEGSNYKEYYASNLGGEYIFAINCLNVPADEVISFTVQTYYQIGDGEVQYENTVTFTVDPTTLPQKGVK